MKKFMKIVLILIFVGSFFAGYISHNIVRNETKTAIEEREINKIVVNYDALTEKLNFELTNAKSEIQQFKESTEGLNKLKNELIRNLEEANNKLVWYEKVLEQITNGEKIEYETIKSDEYETVVYVDNTSSDYTERGNALIKLGVEFSDYQNVSFWFDKEQAKLYTKSKLDRNPDEMLPPYYGMFGEIIVAPGNHRVLLQHGSTGGPIDLVFGKYSDHII